MRTLAVLSRKGGTGKSTVAIHLAVAAQAAGRNTLIGDMDPQRSCLEWRRDRTEAEPSVLEIKCGALFPMRQGLVRAGLDLLLLDTRPSNDGEAAEAVRWADLCLVVVRPSYFDVKAVARTVELISNMGKRGVFVVNQAPAMRLGEEQRHIRETLENLEGMGLPVAPIGLRLRAAYQSAVRFGQAAQELQPDSQAAFEVNMLWRWVERELWSGADTAHPALARAFATA